VPVDSFLLLLLTPSRYKQPYVVIMERGGCLFTLYGTSMGELSVTCSAAQVAAGMCKLPARGAELSHLQPSKSLCCMCL
jgi:hypothetical protein